MPDWAQIIFDALDILKFDGAVQDTLAELREKWGAQVPALLDERFDAVGVQYMKLSHEKGAAALGQELSAFGWALYNLDDEDEYLFALIPEEERSEWERYCKKQGQYCHLMKQQGRKWGDHAKEQDPGKLMPCEEYILQDDPANGQLIDPDCFEYALDNTRFRLNIVRNNRKVLRYLEEHHINTELYGEIVLHYTPLGKPQLESLSAVMLRLFFGELLF